MQLLKTKLPEADSSNVDLNVFDDGARNALSHIGDKDSNNYSLNEKAIAYLETWPRRSMIKKGEGKS